LFGNLQDAIIGKCKRLEVVVSDIRKKTTASGELAKGAS
jgi:hypothetical protein